MDELLGLVLGGFEHAVGPSDRRISLQAPTSDARRDTPNVFQQSQSQHDRECPQFPESKRLNALVCGDEAVGVVRVDTSVLVGNKLQGKFVNARGARGGTLRQSRQFAAVSARQMPTRQIDLLFDEIEIVEQPSLRRGDPLSRRRGGAYPIIRGKQDALVVGQSR